MHYLLTDQSRQVPSAAASAIAAPMTLLDAQKAGLKAFKDGLVKAPALNKEFTAAACASGTSLVMLLDGYLHGWTIGMLAENTTPDFPSAKERARIEAA